MTEIDQVAAARASLEMVTAENEQLLAHFQELSEKLDALEKLPPGIKAVQFRQLERGGAFKFNGADIRHFTQNSKRPLKPSQFVQRTNRRLQNTHTLIQAFLKRDGFDEGTELQEEIDLLANEIIDENDGKAVVEFKKKVEALRETERFNRYMQVKEKFIRQDDEIKAEADILAAKETAADGEMLCEGRAEELADIKKKMDSGEISPEKAQQTVEEMELDAVAGGSADAGAAKGEPEPEEPAPEGEQSA